MNKARIGLLIVSVVVLLSISAQFLYTRTLQSSIVYGIWENPSQSPIIDRIRERSSHAKSGCTRTNSSNLLSRATNIGSHWQDVIHNYVPFTKGKIKIAIGGGLTTKGYKGKESSSTQPMIIFSELFPSFCRTASVHYEYHFYFGYDEDDILSTAEYQAEVNKTFQSFIKEHCPQNISVGGLHLIHCNYSGKPAWAQNAAMMRAYEDGLDFFYRINDDSGLDSANWTEYYISVLAAYLPPFIGLVGPVHDRGPKDIMTHEFVHRSHMDIFGFYYPEVFQNWYADTFMNFVYAPDRCVQLSDVSVQHRQVLGTRYHGITHNKKQAIQIATQHKTTLIRYLEKLNKQTPKKVA